MRQNIPQPKYKDVILLSLRLEGEETIKYRCVCRPPCGKV